MSDLVHTHFITLFVTLELIGTNRKGHELGQTEKMEITLTATMEK